MWIKNISHFYSVLYCRKNYDVFKFIEENDLEKYIKSGDLSKFVLRYNGDENVEVYTSKMND